MTVIGRLGRSSASPLPGSTSNEYSGARSRGSSARLELRVDREPDLRRAPERVERVQPGVRIALAAACASADVSPVIFSILNTIAAWAFALLVLVAGGARATSPGAGSTDGRRRCSWEWRYSSC
jgi:hypothetical protein